MCLITVLTESCKKDVSCPTISCNTGTLNQETCNCICPNGFSGTNCQNEDLCVTQNLDCLNGGTCVDGSCNCPDGFSGVNCEIQDLCFGVNCENGGICIDGTCDCPDGYFGTNCESVDPTQIQALLNSGKSPIELFNGGITLEQLYGKTYEGGLIFYLNTTNGTGMVAAAEDQSMGTEWGCYQMDISGAIGVGVGTGAQNTMDILNGCGELGIAARICGELNINNRNDWFLPSMEELDLMRINLHNQGHGGFANEYYWSSRQNPPDSADGGKAKHFDGGNGTFDKNSLQRVRAARAF